MAPWEAATALELASQAANGKPQSAVFQDYLSRKSDNTIRGQEAVLASFAEFRRLAGPGHLPAEALQSKPEAWHGVT